MVLIISTLTLLSVLVIGAFLVRFIRNSLSNLQTQQFEALNLIYRDIKSLSTRQHTMQVDVEQVFKAIHKFHMNDEIQRREEILFVESMKLLAKELDDAVDTEDLEACQRVIEKHNHDKTPT